MSNDIVFLSGKRTPFGTFLGSLSKVSAIDLGVVAGKAAIEQAGVAVVPGEGFAAPNHVRLSFATDDDSIKNGVARIKDFLTSLK